jgi:hypothetical protein
MTNRLAKPSRPPHAEAPVQAAPRCGNCQFFCDEPAAIEREFTQLRTMSSVYGSVRSLDGLCQRQKRYLMSSSYCASYQPGRQIAVDSGRK